MVNPDVRAAMIGKKLVDIEEFACGIVLSFNDGCQFILRSDWDEDPETLDPVPRAPVIDFVLIGLNRSSSET